MTLRPTAEGAIITLSFDTPTWKVIQDSLDAADKVHGDNETRLSTLSVLDKSIPYKELTGSESAASMMTIKTNNADDSHIYTIEKLVEYDKILDENGHVDFDRSAGRVRCVRFGKRGHEEADPQDILRQQV